MTRFIRENSNKSIEKKLVFFATLYFTLISSIFVRIQSKFFLEKQCSFVNTVKNVVTVIANENDFLKNIEVN